MLSINQKKYINALKLKKHRMLHQSFVVEGVKMVDELLESDFEVESLYATQRWKKEHPTIHCIEVSAKELSQLSALKTPNEVLAVVKQKNTPLTALSNQLTLALAQIQDPGNLGTIIRTADWFGIKNIICSNDSVEVYNSKVLQATMGSFFRMNIVYTDLAKFFAENKGLTVYGAMLEGENVYQKKLKTSNSVLLMGNESNGISETLQPYLTEQIKIPSFGKAESLNVATATAVLCSEFVRQ